MESIALLISTATLKRLAQGTSRAAILLMLLPSLLPGHSMAASPQEKVTIQLSWKYQFQFAPIIAAYEKGFYREAGLTVEILEGGPGIHAVDQVVTGPADYGIYSSSLIVEFGRGKPVIALASIMQHSPVSIISDKPDVKSVLDLAGRSIAASPDTRDEIISYLKAVGIRDKQIKIENKTKPGLENLNDTTAISAYVSNEGFFTRDNSQNFVLFSPRAAGIDLFGNILFTSQQQLKDHPAQVKAFRAATLKGLDYALSHPEELTDIILDKYNSQNKSREHLLYEAEKIRELTRPDIVEPGYMSPGRWQHVASVYEGLGKLPPDTDLSTFIYDPDPKANLDWLYGLLSLSILVIVAITTALWHTRRLTRRLQKEIDEHRQTEVELQASESRFKEFFENNPDPCWLIDNDSFIECNQEAARILGYPDKAALVATDPISVSPPTQPDGSDSETKAREMREIALQKGMHRYEWVYQKRNGTTFPVEVTLAKYTTKDRAMYYCIWRDITERKRIEKMKNEFISTVSHELRTPLTSLMGALGLVSGGAAGELPQKAKSLIEMGLNNANRLLLLINDILDISKIEAGKLEYNMVKLDINQLIKQALDNNEYYGRKYNVRFTFTSSDVPTWSYGDPNRLMQVINNLLSNAAKFSHSGEVVNVKTQHSSGDIIIAIKDSGIGIPPEDHSRVFKKFSQVDSSDTRSMGGTGLGLNISKYIIEAHQGAIYFESEKDKGTTFFVRLPAIHS